MKFGSMISSVATPIAGLIGADCYDPITGDLRPESRCGQARTGLDAARSLKDIALVVYHRFRQQQTQGNSMEEETNQMEWLIVVKVTATDDVADAISKVKVTDGKIAAVNPAPKVMTGGGQPPRVGQTITRS